MKKKMWAEKPRDFYEKYKPLPCQEHNKKIRGTGCGGQGGTVISWTLIFTPRVEAVRVIGSL